MRPPIRGRAVLLGCQSDRVPGVLRTAAQALRSCRRDLQGQRFLPDRLPVGVLEVLVVFFLERGQVELELVDRRREQELLVDHEFFFDVDVLLDHDEDGGRGLLTAELSTYPQLSTAA